MSDYLHGTHPEEQRRLSLLNQLLNRPAVRELGLRGGERILDVGCGLAQLARQMALAAGTRVLGVEQSDAQRAEAERLMREDGEAALVELRAGDAQALPLTDAEWGSFDVAHTRFLLEHVSDPLAVVRGMVRAVRPGGRVVLEDDDHANLRLHPTPPGCDALVAALEESYRRLGADPHIGRRLVALLHEAGARPRRNTFLFFGSCAGASDFQGFIENLVGNFTGARGRLLECGIDAAGFDAAIAALWEWSRRPDAAVWYGVSWAEGVV